MVSVPLLRLPAKEPSVSPPTLKAVGAVPLVHLYCTLTTAGFTTGAATWSSTPKLRAGTVVRRQATGTLADTAMLAVSAIAAALERAMAAKVAVRRILVNDICNSFDCGIYPVRLR